MENNRKNSHIPQGWDYNPSEWSQRVPILLLAFLGFGIAAYLAFYQYEIVENVFEPFFGNGSHVILTSDLSRILPISDAALGAIAYLADAITGIMGGEKRWQTMPWIVVIFGILVGPLGIVSIGLVIAQPLLYNAWCTLCLLSAVVSIIMIGPSMDEVLACLQYLRRAANRKQHSVWRIFWGLESEEDLPPGTKESEKRSMAWPQILSIILGLWLIFAPFLLNYEASARINDYIIGPLVAAFGMIAIWDVTRFLRWVNFLFGAWLLIAPWILNYSPIAMGNSFTVGALLIIFSCQRGRIHHRMDGGWPIIWRNPAMAGQAGALNQRKAKLI